MSILQINARRALLEKAAKENASAATEASEEKPLVVESVPSAQKISNIKPPAALRDLPGWLIWKFEPGEKKPRKVPYYVAGGRRKGVQGSVEDRSLLVTFDEAKAAAERRQFDGVGLAILPEFGVVALDFDQCVVDGGVHPEVENLVTCTYAEYSPAR